MAKIIEFKQKETYNDICKVFEETMKDMDEKMDEIIYDSNKQIDWQHEIKKFCEQLGQFLCKKNIAYGNSIFEQFNIFSKSSVIEKINTRIDDKLSRIVRGKEYSGDDTDLDLIGYLVLRRIWKGKNET